MRNTRHAIVIGAGLAGSAACHRLVLRGWQVTLIERHPDIAQEASGNAAGIYMPVLSRDDNRTSQLARSAYLFALQCWEQLGGIGTAFFGAACGVLQVPRDAERVAIQEQFAQHVNFPADYAQWLDQAAASEKAGVAVNSGGWWFPQGGWVHPYSLCQALLNACGDRLDKRFGHAVSALHQTDGNWQVCDQLGAVIASAPVVIFANGMSALTFPQAAGLQLTAHRGQVTLLAEQLAPSSKIVLCGDGYLTPATQGFCSVGASYDAFDDAQLRSDSQYENLMRLKQLLPDWQVDLASVPLAGRVGFRCVATDRLPLVGALPDMMTQPDRATMHGEPQLKDMPRLPGLYGLLGYASRGLIWAPLAAELLAATLQDEALPVTAELAAALDPARFLLKALRQNKKAHS